MSKNKTTTIFVCCIAILGFAAPVCADESGLIKTVRGQVRIERGGSSQEAKVGLPVREGDRVIVQEASSVGISMSDETLLSLGRNSTLMIDKYAYDPVTREGQVVASILKGTLRFVSGLIGRVRPQAVMVRTNNATIGIRGTDFIVEVPGGTEK
jgi:hypothetical protein